jgi:hypothetical protein
MSDLNNINNHTNSNLEYKSDSDHKSYVEDNKDILIGGQIDDHSKLIDYYTRKNNLSGGEIEKLCKYYAKKVINQDPITTESINYYGKKLMNKVSGGSISSIASKYSSSIGKYAKKLGKNLSKKAEEHLDNIKKKAKKQLNIVKENAKKIVTNASNNLNKNIDKMGQKGGDDNTEESTEFLYSPQLSDQELILLKEDYNKIVNKIKKIDESLKDVIDNTTKNNHTESNLVFKDLLIKRRILIESIKDLEMKYNSINKNDRLDNAIDLIRKDRSIREDGDEKGLDFELDDLMKQVLMTNMELKGACDTLGDLIKLIFSKKLSKTLTGGSVNQTFRELKKQTFVQIGGVNKEHVVKRIQELTKEYIELVNKIKEKENIILGLAENHASLLDKLYNYSKELVKTIKLIHIYNTRFTNKNITESDLNFIDTKLNDIKNKHGEYENQLNVIINSTDNAYENKMNINEKILSNSDSESNIKGGVNSDLDSDDELENKLQLLINNLIYSVRHKLITDDQKEYFITQIENLENVDNVDLKIDELIDSLNNSNTVQAGGSDRVSLLNEELYPRTTALLNREDPAWNPESHETTPLHIRHMSEFEDDPPSSDEAAASEAAASEAAAAEAAAAEAAAAANAPDATTSDAIAAEAAAAKAADASQVANIAAASAADAAIVADNATAAADDATGAEIAANNSLPSSGEVLPLDTHEEAAANKFESATRAREEAILQANDNSLLHDQNIATTTAVHNDAVANVTSANEEVARALAAAKDAESSAARREAEIAVRNAADAQIKLDEARNDANKALADAARDKLEKEESIAIANAAEAKAAAAIAKIDEVRAEGEKGIQDAKNQADAAERRMNAAEEALTIIREEIRIAREETKAAVEEKNKEAEREAEAIADAKAARIEAAAAIEEKNREAEREAAAIADARIARAEAAAAIEEKNKETEKEVSATADARAARIEAATAIEEKNKESAKKIEAENKTSVAEAAAALAKEELKKSEEEKESKIKELDLLKISCNKDSESSNSSSSSSDKKIVINNNQNINIPELLSNFRKSYSSEKPEDETEDETKEESKEEHPPNSNKKESFNHALLEQLTTKKEKEYELIKQLQYLLQKKKHNKTRIMNTKGVQNRTLKYHSKNQTGGEFRQRLANLTHGIRSKFANVGDSIYNGIKYPFKEVGHRMNNYNSSNDVDINKIYTYKFKVDDSIKKTQLLLQNIHDESLKEKYNISESDKKIISDTVEKFSKKQEDINKKYPDIYSNFITELDPDVSQEVKDVFNKNITDNKELEPMVKDVKQYEKELEEIERNILNNSQENTDSILRLEHKREKDIIIEKLNDSRDKLKKKHDEMLKISEIIAKIKKTQNVAKLLISKENSRKDNLNNMDLTTLKENIEYKEINEIVSLIDKNKNSIVENDEKINNLYNKLENTTNLTLYDAKELLTNTGEILSNIEKLLEKNKLLIDICITKIDEGNIIVKKIKSTIEEQRMSSENRQDLLRRDIEENAIPQANKCKFNVGDIVKIKYAQGYNERIGTIVSLVICKNSSTENRYDVKLNNNEVHSFGEMQLSIIERNDKERDANIEEQKILSEDRQDLLKRDIEENATLDINKCKFSIGDVVKIKYAQGYNNEVGTIVSLKRCKNSSTENRYDVKLNNNEVHSFSEMQLSIIERYVGRDANIEEQRILSEDRQDLLRRDIDKNAIIRANKCKFNVKDIVKIKYAQGYNERIGTIVNLVICKNSSTENRYDVKLNNNEVHSFGEMQLSIIEGYVGRSEIDELRISSENRQDLLRSDIDKNAIPRANKCEFSVGDAVRIRYAQEYNNRLGTIVSLVTCKNSSTENRYEVQLNNNEVHSFGEMQLSKTNLSGPNITSFDDENTVSNYSDNKTRKIIKHTNLPGVTPEIQEEINDFASGFLPIDISEDQLINMSNDEISEIFKQLTLYAHILDDIPSVNKPIEDLKYNYSRLIQIISELARKLNIFMTGGDDQLLTDAVLPPQKPAVDFHEFIVIFNKVKEILSDISEFDISSKSKKLFRSDNELTVPNITSFDDENTFNNYSDIVNQLKEPNEDIHSLPNERLHQFVTDQLNLLTINVNERIKNWQSENSSELNNITTIIQYPDNIFKYDEDNILSSLKNNITKLRLTISDNISKLGLISKIANTYVIYSKLKLIDYIVSYDNNDRLINEINDYLDNIPDNVTESITILIETYTKIINNYKTVLILEFMSETYNKLEIYRNNYEKQYNALNFIRKDTQERLLKEYGDTFKLYSIISTHLKKIHPILKNDKAIWYVISAISIYCNIINITSEINQARIKTELSNNNYIQKYISEFRIYDKKCNLYDINLTGLPKICKYFKRKINKNNPNSTPVVYSNSVDIDNVDVSSIGGIYHQYGGDVLSMPILLEKVNYQFGELFQLYDDIYYDIKKLGLKSNITNVDYIALDNRLKDIKTLENKRDKLIEDINYKVIHNNINTIKNFVKTLNTIKKEVNTVLQKLDKLVQTHPINPDSNEIKYIFMTLSRVDNALIFYIYLCNLVIKSKDMVNFQEEFNKLKLKLNPFIKESMGTIDTSATIVNNVWNFINNIDEVIQQQIINFNNTKKSIEEEDKIIHKKKELIIDLEHLEYSADRKERIQDILKEFQEHKVYDKLSHEISVIQKLNKEQESINTLKNQHISKTINAPSKKESLEVELNTTDVKKPDCKFKENDIVSKKGESDIGTVVSIKYNNTNPELKTCDISVKYKNIEQIVSIPESDLDLINYSLDKLNIANIENRMMEHIKIYLKVIYSCNDVMKKEINKLIGINEARIRNIKMLSDVKCQRSIFEMNVFSTKYSENLFRNFEKEAKTINGNVLDIIHDHGKTKLLVKTKSEGIITKELKYCKSSKSAEDEKRQSMIIDENEENIEKAKKLGFVYNIPVICKKVVSPIGEHWNNEKNIEIHGDIQKIIKIHDKTGEGTNIGFLLKNIKSSKGDNLNPEEHDNKYKMDDCKLAFETTLEKLDNKKNKKYILKQFEKLKDIAIQIDKLNTKLPDYEFKLKSLNKIYHNLKDDILDKLTGDDKKLTLEEMKEDNQKEEEFKQEVEINKLKEDVNKLTSKRLLLEKMVKSKNIEDKKDKKEDNIHVGGLNRIQHAGGNYNELKNSINKVDLDSILLESKSLIKMSKLRTK